MKLNINTGKLQIIILTALIGTYLVLNSGTSSSWFETLKLYPSSSFTLKQKTSIY